MLVPNKFSSDKANDIPDSVLTLQQQDTAFSSELLFTSINVTSGESKLVDHMTLRLHTEVGCNWEKIVGSPGQGTTVFPVPMP